MLTLKCSDAGFDCQYIVNVESEQEITDNVKEHVSKFHGITSPNMDPQLVQKIKSIIKST